LSVVTLQNPAIATEKTRVAFHTLGCKLNFSETAEIAKDFSDLHYERVSFDQAADVYVINTCSVTENADKRFKALVAKVLRQNEEAFVAAIGCYAQLQPEALAQVDGVDLVLGASEKFNLTQYLGDLTKRDSSEIHSCDAIINVLTVLFHLLEEFLEVIRLKMWSKRQKKLPSKTSKKLY